jgi:hypothetical protein
MEARRQEQETGLFNTRQRAALESIWHAELSMCEWTRRTGATCSRERRDSCWTPWKFSRLCAQRCHTLTTGKFRPHSCGWTSAWPSPRSNSVPSAHKKGKAGVEYTAYLGGHLLFSLDISRTHRIARPRVLLRQRRRSRRLLLSQHHRIRLGRLPPSPKPTSPRRPMYAVCKPQVAPRFPGSRRRRNHERRCGAESKGLRRCCVQVPTSLPSRCLLHATRDTHDDVTSGKGFRAWRFFGGRV